MILLLLASALISLITREFDDALSITVVSICTDTGYSKVNKNYPLSLIFLGNSYCSDCRICTGEYWVLFFINELAIVVST